MKSKHCTRCGIKKRLEEYSPDKRKKDGRYAACRTCCSAYLRTPKAKGVARKYRQTPKAQEARKQYDNTPDRKRRKTEHQRKFRTKNPDKHRAHGLVSNALKRGELYRPNSCSSCGVECAPDGHHPDYSKPLEVEWLCKPCHVTEHIKLKLKEKT